MKSRGPARVVRFRSQNSGSEYEIRLGGDGNVYCTCPAWRFSGKNGKPRTCKHIKALEAKPVDFELKDGMVL